MGQGETANRLMNPLVRGKSRMATYRRRTAVSLVALLGAITAFNVLIDPYWIYRGPWSSARWPAESQHCSRIAKAEMARQEPIDVALLGDSRALWGLDPRQPSLEQHGVAYNLAMIAASIHESSQLLDVLLSKTTHPPKAVIWLLQPEFVVLDRRPQQNFDYQFSRLNPKYDERQGMLNSLWGSHTTCQSALLVQDALRPQRPEIIRGYAVRGAVEPRTRQKFYEYSEQQRSYLAGQQWSVEAPEMESVLRRQWSECAQRGIRVDVVIPPSHALYWQLLASEGCGERVDAGKRCLVKLAEDANELADGERPIRVWDFSGFTGLAAEPPPSGSEAKTLVYHEDAVHFTKTLGDLLIRRLDGPLEEHPDFGVELTADNLDSHLTAWKAACRNYGQPHEQQLASESVAERR